jgi:lipoprotein NlpI
LPTPPAIYNLFGVSFLVEREFPAAATCFEKALSFDPANVEAMENLKVVQEKMKKE